jgi:hypothetical protein
MSSMSTTNPSDQLRTLLWRINLQIAMYVGAARRSVTGQARGGDIGEAIADLIDARIKDSTKPSRESLEESSGDWHDERKRHVLQFGWDLIEPVDDRIKG